MARNQVVDVPVKTWVQLTDADITALTFQVRGSGPVLIAATVGATPPTNTSSAVTYLQHEGEINVSIQDIFPGLTGANRIYAYSPENSSVFVSYS